MTIGFWVLPALLQITLDQSFLQVAVVSHSTNKHLTSHFQFQNISPFLFPSVALACTAGINALLGGNQYPTVAGNGDFSSANFVNPKLFRHLDANAGTCLDRQRWALHPGRPGHYVHLRRDLPSTHAMRPPRTVTCFRRWSADHQRCTTSLNYLSAILLSEIDPGSHMSLQLWSTWSILIHANPRGYCRLSLSLQSLYMVKELHAWESEPCTSD